ncbi:MAG: hypothetical protein C5B57_06065 [Blastocatellia bacterium]|nr:MAG: hypothetical protein C5B57_06065 [Blastocatellia bacterium]
MLLILGGSAIVLVSAAQDRTFFPGEPTQGKVWIQNRGSNEAVPVMIENGASGMPLRVQLMGNPAVQISSGNVLIRASRQNWEYRDVSVPSGQDPIAMLNTAGNDGWETTGVTFSDQRGTVIVLKRPR